MSSKCSSSEMALPSSLDLQQLAFDHRLRQFDQRVENAEVALLQGDFEGLHVKPVAGEDALRVAPLRVCGRTPAARLRFVDDVVVNQRCGVNDLDDGAQFDGALSGVVRAAWQESSSKAGRRRLPPPARRYSPISVIARTPETVSRPNSRSMADEVVVQQVKDFFGVADYGLQTFWPLGNARPVGCCKNRFSPRRHGDHGEDSKQETFGDHFKTKRDSVYSVPPW